MDCPRDGTRNSSTRDPHTGRRSTDGRARRELHRSVHTGTIHARCEATDTPVHTRIRVHCTSLPSCWRARLRAAVLRVLASAHGEFRPSRGGLPPRIRGRHTFARRRSLACRLRCCAFGWRGCVWVAALGNASHPTRMVARPAVGTAWRRARGLSPSAPAAARAAGTAGAVSVATGLHAHVPRNLAGPRPGSTLCRTRVSPRCPRAYQDGEPPQRRCSRSWSHAAPPSHTLTAGGRDHHSETPQLISSKGRFRRWSFHDGDHRRSAALSLPAASTAASRPLSLFLSLIACAL